METLIINNNTNIPNRPCQNNEIRLDFAGAVSIKNQRVAINYLGIYYSWKNITIANQNNTFAYTWVDGVTYNVTMPDGFFSINDISTYMQLIMYQNNHYMLDSNSNPVYFIRFASNQTFYCCTVDCYPIVVPVGGSNIFAIGNLNTVPQLVILNNQLTVALGITAGLYPPTFGTTTIYSINSQMVPAIVNVTTVYVACNLVNNTLNQYKNVMYSFAPTSAYGTYLIREPYQNTFYDVENGTYSCVSLTFYDQYYRPIMLIDRNISATLIFQEKISISNV